MSAIKKVVVLSNKQSTKSAMAVLTVYKNNAGVFATLKNYDVHIKDAILGISVNDKQVLKQHVSFDNRNSHSFKLDNNFNLDGKIGCVLVESKNGKITPLVWGLSSGHESYKQTVMDSLQALVDKMIEINEQSKKPEVTLKKMEDYKSIERVEKKVAEKAKGDESEHEKSIEKDKQRDCDLEDSNKKVQKDCDLKDSEEAQEDCGLEDSDEKYHEESECKGNPEQTQAENKGKLADKKEEVNTGQESIEDIIRQKSKLKAKELLKSSRTGFHNVESFLADEIMASLDNSSSMQEVEQKTIKVDKISDDEARLFEYTESEVEKEIDDALGFYYLIKDQVDELFAKYPAEKSLENLIPESKWVKVDYENDGRYYVIGLIYEDEELKYICYGVPGTHDKEPPTDFAKYSQWLPTMPSAPEGEGYWLMYQDANDGHSVNLEII